MAKLCKDALEKIGKLVTTKGPEKGAIRKQWTQSGETTLKKEGGAQLAEDLRNTRTRGEIKAGNLVADFRANTKGLTDPEFKSMMDVLQGQGRAINPKVAAAAQAENVRLKQIETQLSQSNQKVNVDPFDPKRQDRAVISDYYTAASNKIIEQLKLGDRKSLKGNKANIPEDVHTEIAKIKAQGGDHRSAYRIADAYFNPDRLDAAQQAIWDKMAGFEVLTKLGLSVIGNATQPANIALITGNTTMLKAAAKKLMNGKAAADLALRSGTTLSSVTHETQLTSGVKPKGLSGKMLEYTGFSPVEVHNRTLAALAGAEHAVNIFKKLKANPNDAYARRHAEQWLGLDPDVISKKAKLSMDDIHVAAHTMADRTQFRTSPLELPPEWRLKLAPRMLTLFKSFSFSQGKLMKEIITSEMANGNFRPLIPLMTMFPILGTLADRIKRGIVGREQPKGFWDAITGAYSAAGGMGIASDMAQRAIAGKLGNWIAGPIVGDAIELIDSTVKDYDLSQGKRASTRAKTGKNVGRFLTKQIPIIGRPLANRVFPYGP